ncbi:hypothetical protein [Haloferax volcanii]|uniref:Uncharacterized protein n=3 Tax=Haloferax volcanii TaxID=2246 RepID=D4GXW8_HALVD|nr:hypothetical protein [Haloferax volcanii]ADE04365.2 uncharacterized protein HVO_2935 [Haloferax volcanii DS2]ELY24545.1 hypothetical protein C498_17860 [Haloferax volcanii DS2]MBS8121129.1 hypothetical protein [Haloferax volcanii]MBS8126140.1 hypothetical protein [Haloferax volcanii]MBS8129994.1 hypothetical protein [Haloferax volcanii]
MRGSKHFTVVMVVAMLAVAMVPGAVGAASSDALQVGVTQDADTGDATVTVTRNETAVENATVVVESSGNYAGNGTYAAGTNGTVDLPNPQERVNATVTVTEGNNTTASSVVLVPLDESLDVSVEVDDANDTVVATVTQYGDAVEGASVMVNGTDYAGNGTYETDADGTVDLISPLQTVTVDVAAEHDGLTAETTVTLQGEVAAEDPFGQLVSSFVERLKDTGSDGPLGQAVSDFVTENNPGNADDKRPDHAGPQNGDDADDESDDDSSDESDDDDSGDDDSNGNGNGGGPPDHANN